MNWAMLGRRMRGAAQALVFCGTVAAAALAGAGCGGPSVQAFRAPGHDPAAARTVLVLPFLDARTFRDPEDPVEDPAEAARGIFLDAWRAHPVLGRKVVVAPFVDRPARSLSMAELVDYGRRFQADEVVAGQLFSYNETRAASIPPRAGMFVRVVSVPRERLVYVGDDYQAAAAPEGKGARDRQARLVADAILDQYAAQASQPSPDRPEADAARVLVLPFHDRPNPLNPIPSTGGGAVVSALYESALRRARDVEVVDGAASAPAQAHARRLSVDEALALGREAGAAYVARGEVVEFRRAKSVPSLWSAAISTTILAAQVLFAEVSGVDVAAEVWRVDDGACVYAGRQSSHQKYVVRAEKTVRALARTAARGIRAAVRTEDADPVEPIINEIEVPDEPPQPPAGETPEPAGVPASEEETGHDG